MNDTAAAALQYYAPRVYITLAEEVMPSAFLIGALTVLSGISAANLIHRGVKQASTAFMLGSVVVLYASTMAHFGAVIAYSVGHCRLLDAVVASPSSASSTSMALTQFARSAKMSSDIVSAALAVNVTVGDIIVWWRVCVLWRKKYIIVLGIFLISSTLVFGIVSSTRPSAQTEVHTRLLLHYDYLFAGLCGAITLFTNMIATLLIGRKAWQHRQVLRHGGAASKRRSRWVTPTMKALLLLVESGSIYSIFLIVVVAYDVVACSPSASLTSGAQFITVASIFLTGCFTPILAIYPTIIIFIVALNHSLIDNSLTNPTDIISSIMFQGSSSAQHIAPRDTRSSQTDCSSDRPGNPPPEESHWTRENPRESLV